MTATEPDATEVKRLRFLSELDVLDTPPDPVLDGLVRCASMALGYPIALVSLVNGNRQWFKARQGLSIGETPRGIAFCAQAIEGGSLFEVSDALRDPRFADNPLVLGEPGIRAYAGMPIVVNGHRLGTLCVIDRVPRTLSPSQALLLADLAQAVAAWFESRREHLDLLAERSRSAERLELLEKLAEQVPGMLFQYRIAPDGAGRFSYLSDQVRQLFALPPAALNEGLEPFLDRIHLDDRPGLLVTLKQAAERATPWRHEFRVQLPGRAQQWRVARAVPTRLHDGTMLWHGFVTDTTEQAEVEQLRREKLAAERANVEKSAFLSRISHELRTPLNAMLGFTQLLQIDELDPLTSRQRERVDHSHRAAQLLLGLINDVLDLSQIEQGAREFDLKPVVAMRLVLDCVAMVSQLAERGMVHVHIERTPHDEDAMVCADRRALEQVLLNLLSNGIKYNRRGGTLTVTLRSDGETVCVALCDQGPGLNAGQLSRLFQPFNRLGAETSQIEGSGLGLVISRQLIEGMGGSIVVESVPGVGSTFGFTLPRHRGHSLPEPVGNVTLEGEVPLHDQNNVCVLYIEDDPVNALLVQEALRAHSEWRVIHASDGPSGLALAQVLRPTVVLTDINLPGLSGQDLVRALRNDPQIRHTICIALSADAMSDQVREAMRAGFDDYWTKPIDVRTLSSRIEAWLDRGSSRFAELAVGAA